MRGRQLRGPLSWDGTPEEVEVAVRRFLCRGCGAALLVVPREVAYRALYTLSAIGLALALWSVGDLPAAEVRGRVSPWQHVGYRAKEGWASLRRWTRAAEALWPRARGAPAYWTARKKAKRLALQLASSAPRPGPVAARVFAGAAQAR